jgi:tetratricopeptide (TPR) repeat protein
VASALGRLAQIQGNPTFAGPERAAEAAATVARALALGGRAWAARRHEWQFVSQHLITLLTRANMLRNQGQPAEGLDVLVLAQQRCAEALTERLSEVGRANLLELSANIATNLAHFNDHSGRPSLGRPEEALRWYGEAEQAFRALYGDATMLAAMNRHTDPGSPAAEEWANHNLANVYVGRALVHQRLGDPAAMKREVEAAILLRQDNLRRAPSSAIWRQSLMFDQNYLAIALLRLGEAAPALAAAQSAWDIAAERLREEGPDSPWLATRGNLAPQYGRALAACGRHKEALPVLDIALQRIAKALAEGDTPALREQQVALQADRARAEQAQVQVP